MPSSFAARCRRLVRHLWHSEVMEIARFYAAYLRLPLLLALGALAVEKVTFYVALPLVGRVEREVDYRQAQHQFAQGHFPQALASVRAALMHSRHDPRFWRLAAWTSERLGSPEAVYCWQQLDHLQAGSLPLQLTLAESALAHDRPDAARVALDEVAPEQQDGPRYQLDAGRLAWAEGDATQARSHFAAVAAGHPTDVATRLILARWKATSPDAAQLQSARRDLLQLAGEGSDEALRDLRQLDLSRRDFAAARDDNARLLACSGAAFADRLAQLDAAGDDPALFNTALTDLLRTEAPAEIASTAQWLSAHGRAEQSLIWIRSQTQETQDDMAVAMARAECLAALGEWPHLRDDQEDSHWAGQENERLAILARADFMLGDDNGGRAAWNDALRATRDEAGCLALLAQAERFPARVSAEAREAVWTLLATGSDWALHQLLDAALVHGDLARAQQLADRVAARDPADSEAAAQAALFRLLRHDDEPKAFAILTALEAQAPDDPVVATAAAYALYLRGQFGAALQAAGALSPAALAEPGHALYLAPLLAVAAPLGRADQVAWMAARSPPAAMEQQALLAQARVLIAYRRARAGAPLRPDAEALVRVLDALSAARSGRLRAAEQSLAGIDPSALDLPGRMVYEGALLELAGHPREAAPRLALGPGVPEEDDFTRLASALASWRTLAGLEGDAAPARIGLLRVDRALALSTTPSGFWLREKPQLLAVIEAGLKRQEAVPEAEACLEALGPRTPHDPRAEALLAYAYLLEGRTAAARDRIDALTEAERRKPSVNLYCSLVLAAGAEPLVAGPHPGDRPLTPEEARLLATGTHP